MSEVSGVRARAHVPVLLEEVLSALPVSAGLYVDATFGRGGHARAMLDRLPNDARLCVFDRDAQAVAAADVLAASDARVRVVCANYSELTAHLASDSVQAILMDLGVSSPQLDQAERGFSFMQQGPLDMRMDQTREPSAKTWLQQATESELLQVLREFGEEPDAKRIARAVFEARMSLHTTQDLAELVQQVKGRGKPGRHPATQVFQAIRMVVNQELTHLQTGLQAAYSVLEKGGLMLIISFHSLEDRMVKQFLFEHAKAPAASRRDFMAAQNFIPTLKLLGKVRAGERECKTNPRARSAVLRIAEKLV